MANIITASSGYQTGSIDTASILVNNVSPTDAAHINGPASAIIQIETILGVGTTLKGSTADLATRLGISIKNDGYLYTAPIGLIGVWPAASIPTYWLTCNGQAVSRTTYSLLYAVISTTYGTGDGSTTFNLPDFMNRSPIGVGTGTTTASGSNGDVDTTGDTLTVASNNTKWITGMGVVFTLTSGTITGLTSGNTYYIIRSSSTLVQLASSLLNAQNGTAINMTAKSSPEWTITRTFSARTLAEAGGSDTHAMTSTQLLAHTHTIAGGAGSANDGTLYLTGSGVASGATGGNVAMNIKNPFLAQNFIIFAGV